MATSTIYDPVLGYNRASFIIDPTEGYYIAGIKVVDGFVTGVSVKSIEHFYTNGETVPSGVVVPSGTFASNPSHTVEYT
jgi:hypothetical protein